jgi:hypothetical protein
MNIKTAFSTKQVVGEAISEIKSALEGTNPKLVVFFASSTYNPEEVAQKMQEAFPSSNTIGCTTSGEIVTGKMLKSSLVAMAMEAEIVGDIKVDIVNDISGECNVRKSLNVFESYYGEPVGGMDINKYVGLVLADGLSGAEEKLLDRLGDSTNVIFIGGSAGDDLKFKTTYVFANGKVYNNAAILALLKPSVEFSFIKTQSFRSLGKTLKATKVNEKAREVVEFNNKPAVEAYAEALGVSVEKLPDSFFGNPVALVSEDDIFVRSPRAITDGSAIAFYCNVVEGNEVSVVENTDIINDTKKAIKDKEEKLGGIQAMLNFNCILRTLELEAKQLIPQYEELFARIPTVGFSTYGEAFIGHINQTATILAFGTKKQ